MRGFSRLMGELWVFSIGVLHECVDALYCHEDEDKELGRCKYHGAGFVFHCDIYL